MSRSPAEKFAYEYHSQARVEWINEQPCVVSGRLPSDNAHTANEGKSRKGHYSTIVPLYHALHLELHQHGVKTFERKYRVDLLALARETNAKWERLLSYQMALLAERRRVARGLRHPVDGDVEGGRGRLSD